MTRITANERHAEVCRLFCFRISSIMVLEPLKGVLMDKMNKSYRLTARGEAVSSFAIAIVFVIAGFATLHLFARAVIWLGELLGVV